MFLGDKAVKPAQEVHAGDVIRVRKGAVYFEWEVVDFHEPRGHRSCPVCTGHHAESQRQKLEEIRAAQRDLLRPVGCPTKRDRRDWRSTSRINHNHVRSRSIAAAETRYLRHRVLWPHKPSPDVCTIDVDEASMRITLGRSM